MKIYTNAILNLQYQISDEFHDLWILRAMDNRRELIKIPPKIITAIVITMIVFFISLIIASQFSSRLNVVDYSTALRSVKIKIPQNRGSIYIFDTLVIHSESKLISKPVGFDYWNNPDTHNHTLGNLKTPYFLSKASNNDTICVIKDRDTFYSN